jgi:hypothetical protein
MGKRNGKRKKEKEFQVNRAGGDFGLVGRRRVRGRVGRRPTRPASGGDGMGTAQGQRRGVGPHARGRGGLMAWHGDGGRGSRPGFDRRESGFATGKWWQGMGGGRGVMEVGSI